MILRAEHLMKKYKTRTVVNDVSVQVQQGEIVGLLGPNGAGKTTSFYMIVGLIKPNEGRIFLDDEEITPLANVSTRAQRAWISGAGSICLSQAHSRRKYYVSFRNARLYKTATQGKSRSSRLMNLVCKKFVKI